MFEGGVGGVMGGMDERSRVRFDRREADEEERECRGEGSIVDVMVEEVKFVVLIVDCWVCVNVTAAVVCDIACCDCSCSSCDVVVVGGVVVVRVEESASVVIWATIISSRLLTLHLPKTGQKRRGLA